MCFLLTQGLFEGLKAYRKHDGNILLFRPEENALRMRMGAERMCMPAPTVEQFVEAVRATVLANRRWVRYPLCICISLSLSAICFKLANFILSDTADR